MSKLLNDIKSSTFLDLNLGEWIGLLLIFLMIGLALHGCGRIANFGRSETEVCIEAGKEACPNMWRHTEKHHDCLAEVRNYCLDKKSE